MKAQTRTRLRHEYEKRLSEHPAVRQLKVRRRSQPAAASVKRGTPRLIAEAMQDQDLATAIPAMRRVMRYHHRTAELVSKRLKGERIHLDDQIRLIRQGETVERDFRDMARSAAKSVRARPETPAYSAAITATPDDGQVFENLPSFLSRSEVAALRYLGVEHQEFSDAWDDHYQPHREEVMELMASGTIDRALQGIEDSAEQFEYSEAPRYLVKRDVITLGGDFETKEVIGTALIVGGAVAYSTGNVWLGIGLVGLGTWMISGTFSFSW